MKKLLLVFPHPDDESFVSGGTAAKYVAAGWEVHLVCAGVQQKELEAAGTILGLSTVTFLGFKDGTLPKQGPGHLEDKVFREMVRLVPHAVITFEPRGINNHPDHVKLTTAATVAFQRYVVDVRDLPQFSDLSGVRKRELGKTYQSSFEDCLALTHEPRLYFACLPQSVGRYLIRQKQLPSTTFGNPWSLVPDKLVTTVIDIRRFRNKKINALQALGKTLMDNNPLLSSEFFMLRMSGYTEAFMGKNDRVKNRL